MTRINVVPVEELCDQHLLAEWRELTRVPNSLISGRAKVDLSKIPDDYVLGAGHVTFFYNKMTYLCVRYFEIVVECEARGFKITNMWPVEEDSLIPSHLWGNYKPTARALKINRERIAERMPKNARFTPAKYFDFE